MKNTLADLNNALFEQIERLQDDELTDEQLEKELKRAKAVTGVASVIVQNGELALKAMQYTAEYAVEDRPQIPAMLKGV